MVHKQTLRITFLFAFNIILSLCNCKKWVKREN